jgi:DNA-binding IclR family transcriptional regulator
MSPVAATSIQAKIDNAPRAKGQRERILNALERAGKSGLTRAQAAEATGAPIQSVCPAVKKLIADGLVVETKRTRPTRTGSKAAVLLVSGQHRRALLSDALARMVGEVADEPRAMEQLGWIEKTSRGYKITAKGWAVIAA